MGAQAAAEASVFRVSPACGTLMPRGTRSGGTRRGESCVSWGAGGLGLSNVSGASPFFGVSFGVTTFFGITSNFGIASTGTILVSL